MTESPSGSDPSREEAPATEQVPVRPADGSEGFARPSTGASYGTRTPEPSSAGTGSSSTGSPYGDPYGPGGLATPPWGGQPATWPAPAGQAGQAGPAGPSGHGYAGHPHRPSGFLANLFDTSFDRFVTPVVAKVAYLVVIVAVGLTWIANVIGALLADPPYALVVLVVGGVIALVTVIGARVLIEAVLALVRLSEDTRALREKVVDDSSSS